MVDDKQRVQDLYKVNTVAGWASAQLAILADMAQDHNLPDWYVREVLRIYNGLETLSQIEDRRIARSRDAPALKRE